MNPDRLRFSGYVFGALRVVRLAGEVLWLPVRLFIAIRGSMTPASVTLLLVCIVSLNIIWGYPWSGMFSACISMLVVGWLINCLMQPSLRLDHSLPNSSPAGQIFQVVTHVENQRRLPAMEVSVAFLKSIPTKRWRRRDSTPSFEIIQDEPVIPIIRSGERIKFDAGVQFHERGIRKLPKIVVTNRFPFHLFASSQVSISNAKIAITPRPLQAEEDAIAQGLLNALGAWSHRLLSGEALDYTGSREYEVGMSVRRWDFPSWARLGKPIVREFQSPSVRMVLLIVDTAIENGVNSLEDRDAVDLRERLLSFAATVVNELSHSMVQIRLYVTGESTTNSLEMPSHAIADSESLLIRLAAAKGVSAAQSDRQVGEVAEHLGKSAILVLSTREDPGFRSAMPGGATIMKVDPAESVPHKIDSRIHNEGKGVPNKHHPGALETHQ